MSAETQFLDAIRAAGINPPEQVEADGKLHRFPSNGARGDDSGWYVLHVDGLPAGAFGCWRSGLTSTWRAETDRKLTPAEQAAHRARIEAAKRERDAEEKRRHAQARERASAIWSAAQPAEDSHPYLARKRVKAHGLRVHEGALVVPMRDAAGELHSLQFIGPEGDKKFLSGGRVSGCYYAIGKPDGVLCIAEGFATAATVHEATGYAVACAFNAGNLESVAKALRKKLPQVRVIIAGDNDKSGTGQRAAEEAARAVGGVVAIPSEPGKDWNDAGAEACKAGIEAALRESARPKPAETIGGAELLDDVRSFIARFVAFPAPWCLDAVTLWAAHAHMAENFHTTPRLAALSPEPESGKTRVLEILDLLTPNSMLILSPSVAAIFRKLAQEQITLLFDEVDTIFTARGKDDQNEDLRALLNAGYRRGASIPRCVGPKHEVQDFAVFAAAALAGIGDLPDTVMTRSIIVRMRRRSAAEHVEQYRVRVHQDQGHALRDRLAQWAGAVGAAAGEAWPELPEGVVDRRAEAWEPLIALADIAGGEWPTRARVAAVADVAAHRERAPSLGVRLLIDLRRVFGADREAVPTDEILSALNAMDEAPWGDLRGKPLDSRGLALRLRKYGVTPKVVRIGASTPRGYTREDLHDAWARYLPPSHPPVSATSATFATEEL